MPAIAILWNLTTAPLASDDMHIACLILSLYRAVQFICIVPLWFSFYISRVEGGDVFVNGLPPWCSNYEGPGFAGEDGVIPLFREEYDFEFRTDPFAENFLGNAIAYFLLDAAWLIMVWNSASIGTPTKPMRRDAYIRNLIIVKMFFINLYPIGLVAMGIYFVYEMRRNNYGCGEFGEVVYQPDDDVYFGLFSCLIITYSIELLLWPAILVNRVVDVLRINSFWNRLEGRGGKADRLERRLGMTLKCLSCIARGKAGGKDLKNQGELKDISYHVMCLLNNQTRLGLVLTDMYVGMRMLSRVQSEKKVEAIKKTKKKIKSLQPKRDDVGISEHTGRHFTDEVLDIKHNESQPTPKTGRRPSMLVLQMNQGVYEVCEREMFRESNDFDQSTLSEGAHFAQYASYIYVKLPNCITTEFTEGDEEILGFKRDLDTLFKDEFQLTSIGMNYAILCYSNFVNGIVATPYSILRDEHMKRIVIVVRGTRSIEDLVIDFQFVSVSLEKVGRVCGFEGEGYHCHKGFLARSKWIYNDIKKSRVLQTLYSERSPFKDYPLVVCGHSLGGGCASVLGLMLRPSFPTLKCFAYEPPGCVFDDVMCEMCEEFITSFVRHDDLVPRLSYHNFETLREEFLTVFSRIKVPKIQLYLHLRVPYSERFAAARNAQVLMPRENIPEDTQFSKQLEKLRAERAEKNDRKEMIHLAIPGKIVHLVDTNGTGNYIPHWAKRDEFNQLEISKRMYSDHDIHSLVKIIGDIDLQTMNTASLGFHDAPLIYVDDEDVLEADTKLFTCCSNPYGKLPFVLFLLGLFASTLSTAAGIDCDFVRAEFPPTDYATNTLNLTFGVIHVTFGLFTYDLLDCDSTTGPCGSLNDYSNFGCIPYPPKYDPGAFIQAGRGFHTIANMLGSFAVLMICISLCFIYKQRTWKIITALLLVVSLCEGLVFITRSTLGWCSDPDISCTIGSGAIELVVSCCTWFLMAIGSGYLAKRGKKPEYQQ